LVNSNKIITPKQNHYDSLEVDELWTYVGNKKNKIWLIYAYHRETGGIFRVIAMSVFCDSIRLLSVLNFLPRNDLPRIFQQVLVANICYRVAFFVPQRASKIFLPFSSKMQKILSLWTSRPQTLSL
jgi:hypothetical protein